MCEGPTEQEFCTEVLGVEFAKHDIYVEAPVIKHSHGGIVPWVTIKKQILNHLQEGDVNVSMLVDYYGIKDQFGFPGWEESKEIVDKTGRIHFLIDRIVNWRNMQLRPRLCWQDGWLNVEMQSNFFLIHNRTITEIILCWLSMLWHIIYIIIERCNKKYGEWL